MLLMGAFKHPELLLLPSNRKESQSSCPLKYVHMQIPPRFGNVCFVRFDRKTSFTTKDIRLLEKYRTEHMLPKH